MTTRRLLVVFVAAASLLLSGCAVAFLSVVDDGAEAGTNETDSDWVVVTYTLNAQSPTDAMDVLLETEMAADAALAAAGAGPIDGNEVGGGEYQLHFVGADRHQMWQVLEPVLAQAPLEWSRVELLRTLGEDPDEVILPR